MKRIISAALSLALAASLASCSGNGKQAAQTNNAPAEAKNEAAAAPTLKIAYVELDSLLKNYQGYKDMNAKLEQKAKANESLLTSKVQAVQNEAQQFQQKLQSNGFVNELAAKQEYDKIMKKQEEGRNMELRLQNEFIKLSADENAKLYNDVRKAVENLNQTLGYDFILTDTKSDNILYGDPKRNITGEVIEALNKQYNEQKSSKK